MNVLLLTPTPSFKKKKKICKDFKSGFSSPLSYKISAKAQILCRHQPKTHLLLISSTSAYIGLLHTKFDVTFSKAERTEIWKHTCGTTGNYQGQDMTKLPKNTTTAQTRKVLYMDRIYTYTPANVYSFI